MEDLSRIILGHPFFAGLDPAYGGIICGCARNVRFEAGEFLFHAQGPANEFYLLRHGRVALEVTAPDRGTLTFQTLGAGEIVGLSWLIPPYRFSYDARALELVRAISMDAACLRAKCEADHDLGYEMMKRFTPVLVDRLDAARVRLLDLYAGGRAASG